MTYRDVTVKTVFNAYTLAASTTAYSDPIDLGAAALNGYVSVQYRVQGTGTVAIGYQLSNDGTNFVFPTGTSYTVKNSLTATSGTGANGRDLFSFSPTMAARMKMVIWETSGAGTTVTLQLAIQ